MTVANQLRVEHRRAPCAPRCDGGECAARTIHRVSAVEGCGCAATRSNSAVTPEALRGQSQLAAGDEIELPRLAPDFQHHGAQRIAGQRVGGGAQRGVHIGGAHRHQQARIEAEFGQSAHRQRAGFDFGKILPHPDQRPPRRQRVRARPAMKPGRRARSAVPSANTSCTAPCASPPCSAASASAWPSATRSGACAIAMRLRCVRCCRANRKRVRACAGHAPAPSNVGRHWFFERTRAGSFVHDMF